MIKSSDDMGLLATFVLYLTIGVGVSIAVFVRSEPQNVRPWFVVASAAMFWPLYVPLLLSEPVESIRSGPPALTGLTNEAESDELAVAIHQAEVELDAAVASLDGWTEHMLACEADRFDELKQAWRVQASRIRELTELLEQNTEHEDADTLGGQREIGRKDRVAGSRAARRANLQRLRDLRDRMQTDLLETLAWVGELVTRIHLARYTGAPASRAADLVAQIAAAVEGLSEVSELQAEVPVVLEV